MPPLGIVRGDRMLGGVFQVFISSDCERSIRTDTDGGDGAEVVTAGEPVARFERRDEAEAWIDRRLAEEPSPVLLLCDDAVVIDTRSDRAHHERERERRRSGNRTVSTAVLVVTATLWLLLASAGWPHVAVALGVVILYRILAGGKANNQTEAFIICQILLVIGMSFCGALVDELERRSADAQPDREATESAP